MTISDTLLSSFPKTISRQDEVFSALVANPQKTGCLETLFRNVDTYMKGYSKADDFYNADYEIIKKIVDFLTYFERFENETEESFKNRINAVFYRNGDDSWGTPWDLRKVFEQYFPSADIYIVENAGKVSSEIDNENILLDFDFQSQDVWETDAEYSRDARFSKSYGIKTSSGTYCKQTVEVQEETDYMLHFFLNGKIRVEIKDGNGRYWDSKEFYDSESESWKLGKWVNTEKYTDFTSSNWNAKSMAFITDSDVSEIEINFIGVNESFLDYTRLFEKHDYPTFTVIAQFEGGTAKNALGLAAGNEDPIDGSSSEYYKNTGYYNGAFLTGVNTGFAVDIYNDLLDYLRTAGTKAYLEIVIKDN